MPNDPIPPIDTRAPAQLVEELARMVEKHVLPKLEKLQRAKERGARRFKSGVA